MYQCRIHIFSIGQSGNNTKTITDIVIQAIFNTWMYKWKINVKMETAIECMNVHMKISVKIVNSDKIKIKLRSN